MKSREVPRVDVAAAIEAGDDNMYMTIIAAAAAARVIKKERDKADMAAGQLHYHTYKPVSQALLNIINKSVL